MTTPPLGNIDASPSIPLTDEVRTSYKNLYDKIQDAIDNNTDVAVLEALNQWQSEVDDILTKDNMYRLHANTGLFNDLLKQIKYTNKGLKTLHDQITAIASHFQQVGDVLAAINKVLTLIP